MKNNRGLAPLLQFSLTEMPRRLEPNFWQDWQRQGEPLGFLRPTRAEVFAGIKQFIATRGAHLKRYCLAGIGGSALPARAMSTFLNGEANLTILDSIDPRSFSKRLKPALARPEETLFHVISKSGTTLEIELIRLEIVRRLQEKLPQTWPRQMVVTTTPGSRNPLEQWAKSHKITIFPLEEDIGGRFSTFSPVTYLLAAFLGFDPELFWEGSLWILERQEAALSYAEFLHDGINKGRSLLGIFTYGDELADFGDFLQQLFAESLGKDGKGLTPCKFVGTRDQHSLLQLYLDGPKDKMVTLLEAPKPRQEMMGKAFCGALYGVEKSLQERGVPHVRLTLSAVTPQVYGALAQFFHLATIGLGSLLGINPFNQPMVELQKAYTKEYLSHNNS